MLILDDVLKYCSDASLARVLGIAKRILDMLQIVGPILCIISCIYIFLNTNKYKANKAYIYKNDD